MRFFHFLIFLISLKKTTSFFGFNIVYPAYSGLSSECIKATSSLISLPLKLEQTLIISSKFSSTEYNSFTQSLTDLRFFFNGLHIFLQQYSDFINESTTSNPLKVITLLRYNAQLMESATDQISNAPKNFEIIFGSNLESAVDLLITKYTEQIKYIRLALETLYLNFESIINSGLDISVEILDAEIDHQATTDTFVAFQEITIASKQMTSLVSGVLSILQVLDEVTSKIIQAENLVLSSASLLSYSLNLEIKSARFKFSDHIRSSIDEIIQSSGNYSHTSFKVFFNTTSKNFLSSLHDQQKILDDFNSQTSEMLWKLQIDFSKKLQIYYDVLYKSMQIGHEIVSNATKDLKNYLSHLIIQNSGSSFKKCFEASGELNKHAVSLLSQLDSELTKCANEERTLALQIEGLMEFIVEDVILNIQGAFDNLCKCSVRGGNKTLELTKGCISEITTDLSTETFKEDEKYLNIELDQASDTLQKSEKRFQMCIDEIKKSHNTKFAQFQQASLTCLVSQ